jgi:hypothetical protein
MDLEFVVLTLIFGTWIFLFMFLPLPAEVRVFRPKLNKTRIIVGVISDTHLPTRTNTIPARVFEVFEGVDLIIHAGDFVDLSTAKELESIAPLIGVEGNMDWENIRRVYPTIAIVELLNYRIGVWHGSFLPFMAKRIAAEHELDVLISGHTHRASIRRNKVLFLNPGSPTNPFLARASVALLNLTQAKIEAKIVYL